MVSQTPTQRLTPYLGQIVQFPLGRALNVKKGYVIALTVPTWAPALTQLLTDQSSWRASRPKGKCDDTGAQTAQTALKAVAQYRCLYKARLTYSAIRSSPARYPIRGGRPPGLRLARRQRGELDALGPVGDLRRVLAEQIKQRVDDVGVELLPAPACSSATA